MRNKSIGVRPSDYDRMKALQLRLIREWQRTVPTSAVLAYLLDVEEERQAGQRVENRPGDTHTGE